jgi:hypothetical protein
MSYLDPPRLHFAGQFWTNPSTINNATENYDPSEVYNNNPPSDTNPNSVWWNQMGQAFFKIPSGTVTSAVAKDGQALLASGDDPIVGATLENVLQGSPMAQFGKLVDLDPDQQGRSLVVGVSIQISIPLEPGVSLLGDIRPMTIIDLWGRVTGGGAQGIESAGAMFQSVLENLHWNGIATTRSAFLRQLYAASPNMLSIKFTFDGYNGDITSPQFACGRMVGAIGPYVTGEPIHFLAKRRVFTGAESVQKFYPPSGNTPSPMNAAPFQLSGRKLVIDLANSVPTTAGHQGPFADLGTVSAVIDPLGANTVLNPPLFSSADEYTHRFNLAAGIFELDLGANAGLLANKPLAIQIVPPTPVEGTVKGTAATRLKQGLDLAEFGKLPGNCPAAPTIALAEGQSGYFACVDLNALRLEAGAPSWSTASESGVDVTCDAFVPLLATKWGEPAQGLVINITVTINQYQFHNAEGELYNINNDPMSAISWSQQVTTDANGRAAISFTAMGLDPSQKTARRQFVDGQLYFFTHDYSMDTSGPALPGSQWLGRPQPISLLVFENRADVANPTWWQNIQPILFQYARLYPFMRSLIDLSDYAALTNSAFSIPTKIQAAISLPRTHPAYMPVTRDLSVGKTKMILTWIKNGMPEGTAPTTQNAPAAPGRK